MVRITFFVIFAVFSSLLHASAEVDLPPIVKTGTPGEALLEDPILPAVRGSLPLNSGSGSIQNSLQNKIALPLTDYGRPGGTAQLRGLGFSSEELDVQAFGISLNPPQGGGFDLSVFPQFLWSGFQFQSGPPLNGSNQTATVGTLNLVPWSSEALKHPGRTARAIQFYSSSGVNQVSLAGKSDQDIAVVAGYSSEKAKGPSMALSSQWGSQDRNDEESGKRELSFYSGQFHLLATDLEVEAPGPTYNYSPEARMKNTRIIPILQNDFRLTRASLLKTSLFYDATWLNYNDPNFSTTSKSQFQQAGFSQAYLVGSWKVGSNLRWIRYRDDFQTPPSQIIGNVQVSQEIEAGSFLFQPNLQGVWVTGFGFLPQGGMGIRKEWNQGREAVFTRFTLSHRIPSLLDWYAQDRYFQGNPNLTEEKDWTAILGGEIKRKEFQGSLQSYAQLRKNARVPFNTTVSNLGDAHVVALMAQYNFTVTDHADLFGGETLSHSRLMITHQAFPYLPTFIHLTGISLHSRQRPEEGIHHSGWNWTTSLRAFTRQSGSASTGGGDQVGGYSVVDTGIQKQIWNNIQLAGRVENLFNRPIEVIRGYPFGRSASILLSGEI